MNTLTAKEAVIFLGITVAVILGARLIWAQLVYHDMRCVFAECRINI